MIVDLSETSDGSVAVLVQSPRTVRGGESD